MNKLMTFFATSFVAAATLASPVMAHSVLKGSKPAADSTVLAPTSLELTFSDSVNLRFSKVAVTGANDVAAETGKPTTAEDGQTLVVPVSSPLSPGKYTVSWDALSKDGHKVNGKFSFTVK